MSENEREGMTIDESEVGVMEDALGEADPLLASNNGDALEVGVEDDLLATPEIAVPPAEPEAHRGTIQSIELHTAETGSVSFRVNLLSTDTGKDDVLDVWLPRMFVADIGVDPETLPEEKGNNQRVNYRIGVSNSQKDATIQGLRLLAAKLGRKYTGPKPTTIDEFIQGHNELLAGLDVVYTKKAEKIKEGDDNRFAGRLRVGSIMSQEEGFSPKALKKYHKLWE